MDYDPMIATRTIREHCRAGMDIDGADARAMWHALIIAEKERNEARAERNKAVEALADLRDAIAAIAGVP